MCVKRKQIYRFACCTVQIDNPAWIFQAGASIIDKLFVCRNALYGIPRGKFRISTPHSLKLLCCCWKFTEGEMHLQGPNNVIKAWGNVKLIDVNQRLNFSPCKVTSRGGSKYVTIYVRECFMESHVLYF